MYEIGQTRTLHMWRSALFLFIKECDRMGPLRGQKEGVSGGRQMCPGSDADTLYNSLTIRSDIVTLKSAPSPGHQITWISAHREIFPTNIFKC